MQCPSCDGKLKELKFGNFAVSGCRPCDGFWLKKEDVNQFLTFALELQNQGKKFQNVEGLEKELLNGQFGKYCPTCNNPTDSFDWGDSGITSFKCGKNCGVWVRMKQLGNIVDWWQYQSTVSKNYRFFKMPAEEEGIISTNSDLVRGLAGWISDDIRVTTTPFIVIILIVINVLSFTLNFILQKADYTNLCLVPNKLFSDPILNSYTIFTSMFLHADLGHLFGNMFFLYLFGKSVEDRIGKRKFILVYLITGVVSALAHALLTNYPSIPTLGASGAISGIMGGYLILFPRAKISFHKTFFLMPYKLNLPAWFYLGVWFVGQQLLGIAISAGAVAWYAHLSGFIFGLATIAILKLRDNL
jgi:membrane associated rhomboid family serine protease